MPLNQRSLSNLEGVHPDLVSVVMKASEKAPFLVTEGLRTKERQATLVKAGKSKTLNSRHLTGHAVDLCDPDGCYDLPDMTAISRAMKSAAAELDVKIDWGGDWKWKDTPHFELDRKAYPANAVGITTRVLEVASKAKVAAPAAAGATAAVPAVAPTLPAPPDLAALSQYRAFGEQLSDLGSWAWNNWWITAGLVLWMGAAWGLKFVRAE